MEKIKKYFEFSGTISGGHYFLRTLLSTIMSYIGGFVIGYGIGSNNVGLIAVGLVVVAPAVVFSFATIYKRCKALFGTDATLYTLGLIIAQVSYTFLSKDQSFGPILQLGLFVFGLVLIFKNSNIQNHEG